MKHRSGCSDCTHNKANGIDVWHCSEVDIAREAKYHHDSVFNCFDYHAMQQQQLREIDVWHCSEVDSEIDALIDSANQQIEDIFFSCVKVEQAQWNAWLATCEQIEQLWIDNMTD